LSSILPAAFTGAVFVLTLVRLPALHPSQVWAGSWAVATLLYALRLLPYRDLSWLTALLICGAVVAFVAGVPLGERLARRRRVARDIQQDAAAISLAAGLTIALLAFTLAIFLAQLVSKYGTSRVLRISPEVKAYLSSGTGPVSATYVDVAFAATAFCAMAGALSSSSRRLCWLTLASVCAGTVYFSTSRGFIVVALITGLAAFAAAGSQADRLRLAMLSLAALPVILALFIGLGSLLGKTYGNSTVGEFDNFFSRHPATKSLALPYQDLSAGIPALDLLVGASSTWGRAHGCATAPPVCGVIRKLGVPVVRVPVAGPFTKAPMPWNAYTFLDRYLIDGGTALSLLFVVATGAFAGYFWARARARSAADMIVYAIGLSALVSAYRQNLIQVVFFASLLSIGVLLLARRLVRYTDAFGRRLAHMVR
jgi:oligosaccharide repeat unit polymerase